MPLDLQMVLRLLQLLLQILEQMPARADHRPVATSARQMIDDTIGPALPRGPDNA